MSFHFYVPAEKTVTYRQLLGALQHKNAAIAWQEEYDLDETARSARFYIPGRSSRGIGVHLEKNQYDIGINVLSSGEDNALALDLARTLAHLQGTSITPEDEDGPLDTETFNARFNAEWVDWHKKSGTGSILYFVHDPERGGTVSIGGCFRSHYIGKKLLARLGHDNPAEDLLYDRLIDNIRQTQFINEDLYRIPAEYLVKAKDNEPEWKYIVVSPGNAFFLPKTEYLILFVSKEKRLKIPYADIHRLADGHFKPADEEQYFVEALPEALLEQMIDRAGAIPGEKPDAAPKKAKGWKFWK